MKVSSIGIDETAEGTRVTARIDDRELWFAFRGPQRVIDPTAGIVAACIYPAMALHQPLEFADDLPVSPRLVTAMDTFQEIYASWYPETRKVPFLARLAEEEREAGIGVASLFSGGVDSFYTFLTNEPAITHLIFCGGIDIHLDETARFNQAVSYYGAFAARRNKQLVVVSTNAHDLWPGTQFSKQFGHFFAGIGLMLGMREMLVPASQAYGDMGTSGSHALTDPLFSTERTRVVHHSPTRRSAKIAMIVQDVEVLSMLRVCNSSDQYNCGECEKCLRTMTVLRLLHVESPVLPPLVSLDPVRRLRIYGDPQLPFWQDNHRLAVELGDAAVARVTRMVVDGYVVRRALRQIRTVLQRRPL